MLNAERDTHMPQKCCHVLSDEMEKWRIPLLLKSWRRRRKRDDFCWRRWLYTSISSLSWGVFFPFMAAQGKCDKWGWGWGWCWGWLAVLWQGLKTNISGRRTEEAFAFAPVFSSHQPHSLPQLAPMSSCRRWQRCCGKVNRTSNHQQHHHHHPHRHRRRRHLPSTTFLLHRSPWLQVDFFLFASPLRNISAQSWDSSHFIGSFSYYNVSLYK